MFRLVLTTLLICLSGCETISNIAISENVKPWQRDVLAYDAMQLPPDRMHQFSDDHIYFSKEASTGGNGVGGGGCGCN
jgi:hypothetical protein